MGTLCMSLTRALERERLHGKNPPVRTIITKKSSCIQGLADGARLNVGAGLMYRSPVPSF